MLNHEDLEAREAAVLGHLGLRSRESRGRRVPEPPDPLRTCFQRDRDRILHSSSFRRLQQKTQVLPATTSDHHRTRLTHTLEVSQLARSASIALGLNADVAEAVALAHDLGHPPFGHAGERALHSLMKEHGGFRHNAQGLRIVDDLEESYAGRDGLNLCWETRICLLKSKIPAGFPIAVDLPQSTTPFLEGQIVDLCDRIAYVCHDMDDAIRAGIVPWRAFAGIALPGAAHASVLQRYPELASEGCPDDSRLVRIQTVSAMIASLVHDLVLATDAAIQREHRIRTADEARALGRYLATHSPERRRDLTELLRVLRERFYRHEDVLALVGERAERAAALFERFLAAPETMPERYVRRIDASGLQRTVCDYVAGMTDRFVERLSAGDEKVS